ncbi:MAG: adenosylcobinamide-GDP ribazoletransferase [Rhodospirillales bacterium]|nr:adenosylcobinamide-GDP ribazoletransferase [Rhodospirillales bacterium]
MVPDDISHDWSDRVCAAVGFLTRLPVRMPEDMPLARAVMVFPLVGAGVGFAGGFGFLVAVWIGLGPWLAAVAAVLVMIALTGALHEDGLADVADGFGVHGPRERKLEVLRDSRIGAFGVIALVLFLAARIGALTTLADPATVVMALVAAGALSRGCVVVAMRMMVPARADGLGARAGMPDFQETMAALLVAAAITVVMLLPFGWISALILGCGAAFIMAGLCQRTFEGKTGDVLGAVQQTAEVGVLAAAVAAS